MARIVIIHGAYGTPEENWIPYLRDSCEQQGDVVITPTFPTPENQTLANWLEAFGRQVGILTEDTVLVGHSIGVAFILSLLQSQSVKIRGIVLASGFMDDFGNEEFDGINQSFTHAEIDWDDIRSKFVKGYAFHGSDDPYVPQWMGEEIANNLDIACEIIEGGGHLNATAGFEQFPRLLDVVRQIANG
jgi:predicted alpha/beta hydrolase family esterase